MAGVATTTILEGIAEAAAAASDVWARAVLPAEQRVCEPLFGTISGVTFAEGVEMIYEAYLVHHAARGRVFAVADYEQGLLLGDYLYATGLVQVCQANDVAAIAALADLIALAAHLRVEGGEIADGELWLATARYLAGPRSAAVGQACEALRGGDSAPLRALVTDPAAAFPIAEHRRLMGETA